MFEVIAGYSNMLFIPELSAGFNIKFDRQQLAGFADSGFGCDAGLYYEKPLDTDDNISAGLNIKNLIEPSLNLAGSPDNLPRQALLGVSYSRLFGKELKTSFFLDGSVPLGSEFQYNAGMELAIFRTLFIRAGYNSYEISSLGAGLDLFDSVSVDYGFFMTGIDDQHRVSLRMRFGGNMSEARQNRDANENAKIEAKAKKMAAEELEKMKKSIEDLKKDASTKEYFKALHYTKGLEAYFDSDYKRSLAEFETVRNIDDNYLNTRTYLSMLRNILSKSKQENYSDEILKLYRSGVEKYMKQDYKGAKADWEKILKIDPYNKLATDNLKEVNSLLRDIEKIEE
jgi:tetratricopeptide (TPR) repeat protein